MGGARLVLRRVSGCLTRRDKGPDRLNKGAARHSGEKNVFIKIVSSNGLHRRQIAPYASSNKENIETPGCE
jgi:hypothetical protein